MISLRQQTGDTIVEVLIAMAIASLVLGSAYAITNRTLANARQAQEHSEALRLAQGQIERLDKVYSANPSSLLVSSSTCIDASNVVKVSSDAACTNPIPDSVGYRIVTTHLSTPSDHFMVTITWPSAVSGGDDSVTQSYRVVN